MSPAVRNAAEPARPVRIVACVVTYQRLPQLTVAIERLLAEPVDMIVVVDNGSTDGSREWLRSLADDRIDVLEPTVNLGGAGGFELALKRAVVERRPDWLMLQDDDAWPVQGAIERFRELSLPSDVGGVAAAVYTPSGEICEMNRPGVNPFGTLRGVLGAVFRGRRALHVADEVFSEERTDVDCVSFVGYFVRAALVPSVVGYPRGEFFVYSDDQLFSFEIRRAGYRNVLVPGIEFCHDTLSKSDTGVFTPLWRVYFLYRNNIEFYRAMAGRWFALVMLLKIPSWLLRARHYPDPKSYLSVARRGIVDGLRRRFDMSLADVQRLGTRAEATDGR
ncbi:MAG: glycosyltransferase [Ilumatobacter sp.]